MGDKPTPKYVLTTKARYGEDYYQRLGKQGGGRPVEDLLTRFWRHVKKDEGGCWLWTGQQNGFGYARMRIKNKTGKRYISVHRWYYELVNGSVPEGMELDHLCRTRNCVNPDHLQSVTRSVNVRRGLAGQLRPKPTHCKRGHALTDDNIYIWNEHGRVTRTCKICELERQTKIRQQRRLKSNHG